MEKTKVDAFLGKLDIYSKIYEDIMDHINLFQTNAEFNAAYNGSDYVEPWVSFTIETSGIAYNKREEPHDYSQDYLTFNIISSGTINWKASTASFATTIEYSIDNGSTWSTITSDTGASAPSISVSAGDVVQFRGNNSAYTDSSTLAFCSFSGSTAKFEVEGNIMSLIDSTGYTTATTLASSYSFYFLFRACTGLTSAENFILPATTLTRACYMSMFDGCTSLTTAPVLPATTLAVNCYQTMFNKCTSLVTAPELSTTTLAYGCYYSMFKECASLITAPALPATALAEDCYRNMLSGCTSLATAPELPATTLAARCYHGMFQNCTSLTTAPALPATTLSDDCYYAMFQSCTNLTTAPELPAVSVATRCYSQMFRGCTNLTTAPELPATTLAEQSYSYMFSGCTKLNYIKCLATDMGATYCTSGWISGVQTNSGTFVKANTADWSSKTGNSGIPANWTVEDAS